MLIDEALAAIADERADAIRVWSRFNSYHEGYAVIKEEVDELWEEIKRSPRDVDAVKGEAIQVGAMILRFLNELCD